MKKVQMVLVAAILAIALLSSCSSSIGGATELLSTLGKLGVTPDQAIGGLGSIMSLAQGKLSPEDFTKVSKSIPGLDNVMKQATDLGAIRSDYKYGGSRRIVFKTWNEQRYGWEVCS